MKLLLIAIAILGLSTAYASPKPNITNTSNTYIQNYSLTGLSGPHAASQINFDQGKRGLQIGIGGARYDFNGRSDDAVAIGIGKTFCVDQVCGIVNGSYYNVDGAGEGYGFGFTFEL